MKLADIDTWEKQKALRAELDLASKNLPVSQYIPRAMDHLLKVWGGMGYTEEEIKNEIKAWADIKI